MNVLALCAGVGGLELGLHLAEPCSRVVCWVERDAYAAATLVARMEDSALDQAPIWDDLATFEGGPWRGGVDLVCAGFPCQPFSLAGKRQAQDDERHLWPHIARVVREVRPGLVFLENVPGLLVRGFGDVLGDLAGLGFDAAWAVFSAAGSGAPHLRRRVFLLAAHPECAELRHEPGRGNGASGSGACEPGDDGEARGLARPPARRVVPYVGRAVNAAPHRLDRLRCLGNGVVPAVAARAFTTLRERLTCP